MADFNALETLINAYIKKNGVQAITGNILNGVLRGMVSALGKGYTVIGVATPSTDPGTMTGPCAYYASQAGTYTNFGGLVVNDGDVAMLIYDEQTWHKEVMFSLSAEASVDANVGTPWVNASFENGMLTFTFGNLKGNPGDAAGFGTVNATVDSNIGTPGVSVQTSGPDTAKNMTFQFTNLKGETGVTSVVCTVDNTIGTPSCAVSLVGQELHLDFSGLKGNKGDTGVSADYPITIYNGLDSTATDQALSAYQGKVLNDEISQLDLKLNNLAMTRYYGIFTSSADLPEDATELGYAYVGATAPFAIYEFDGEDWTDTGATIESIQGEPGVGFESTETPTPADGTFIIHLTNGDSITVDMNHGHAEYYSKVVGTAQPSGGFLPDVAYNLGEISGTVIFALASAVTGQLNHYFWMFSTGASAPTVTFPSTGITWAAGSAPTVAANKKYEISILNGVAYYSEV